MCHSLKEIFACLAMLFSGISGFCGIPGSPKQGDVSYNHENASYTCPATYVIEGDVTRKCVDGRWLGRTPRCAMDVTADANPTLTYEEYAIINKEHLLDKNSETCWWYFSFVKKVRVSRVTLRLPYGYTMPYDSWRLEVKDGNTTLDLNPKIHLESPLNIQWRFDYLLKVDSILILTADAHNCEVSIYAWPDECDEPDQPANGYVNVTEQSAQYFCNPGFQRVGDSVRNCSDGQWIGIQPICQIPIIDQSNNNLNYRYVILSIALLIALLLIALLFIAWKCRRSSGSLDFGAEPIVHSYSTKVSP